MPYDGRHGRDRGGGRDRDRFGFDGFYGWPGYPYLPWWDWGYPFLWDNWDDSGGYDAQPGNDAAQAYPEYAPAPYDPAPEPSQPQQPAAPWPYSRPAPSESPAPPPAPEAPVTLVFKDGRPHEQIRNYLMTATTLSVLDQHRREIPVDQIDLAATVKLNRESGVDFNVPGGSR